MVMIVATLEGMVNKLVSKVLNLIKKIGSESRCETVWVRIIETYPRSRRERVGIERGEQPEYRRKVH